MAGSKKEIPFPTKEALLGFIRDAGGIANKNEIARAFHLKGDDRVRLKEVLREMKAAGEISGGRPQREKKAAPVVGPLPEVCVVTVTGLNEEGELLAKPVNGDEKKEPPYILITDSGRGRPPGIGERALVRLKRAGKFRYHASVIKVLPTAPSGQVLGVFVITRQEARIEPVSKKDKFAYLVRPEDTAGAQPGELVAAEIVPARQSAYGLRQAKVTERLGSMESPKAASLIAIHSHDIPVRFSPEAQAQAENAPPPAMAEGRVDLRAFPLITIDGEDARDFDDAVWAESDTSGSNPGGWHLLVAIADVAHYVHAGDELDKEAFNRGNSVYFPDRVVPMLPEALSNGLCSLRPEEDRYCLAVHLWIDAEGKTLRHQFVRGLMRSVARMTYEKIQYLHEHPETADPVFRQAVVEPLYGAYRSLDRHRELRGTLDLDLPEYQIQLGEDGSVTEVRKRERLASHKLIEEFMIAANVAAAHAIEQHRTGGIFRIHQPPDLARITDLREFLGSLGYNLSRGEGLQAKHFNKVLERARDKPESPIVSTAILRSQTQAYYSHENSGHFGLSLAKYCHFTSPIRRYSDLIVHRALIAILDKDAPDALTRDQILRLPAVAEHISTTERRAMLAEREAHERYLVSYMAKHEGADFAGVIVNANNFGLFVALRETGAQGFIPIRTLGSDFYRYDKASGSLTGQRSGERYGIGQKVRVRLKEANTTTGSLLFELLEADIPILRPAPTERRFSRTPKKNSKAPPRQKGKKEKPRKTKKNKSKR